MTSPTVVHCRRCRAPIVMVRGEACNDVPVQHKACQGYGCAECKGRGASWRRHVCAARGAKR